MGRIDIEALGLLEGPLEFLGNQLPLESSDVTMSVMAAFATGNPELGAFSPMHPRVISQADPEDAW
jgi:hypothetical protein